MAAQQAFDTLKQKVTKEPVLLHPILTRLFELKVDASGFAIGAVLMQKGDCKGVHSLMPDLGRCYLVTDW